MLTARSLHTLYASLALGVCLCAPTLGHAGVLTETGALVFGNGQGRDNDKDSSPSTGPVLSRAGISGVGEAEGAATTSLGRNSTRASAGISVGAEPNCTVSARGVRSCLSGKFAEGVARSVWSDTFTFASALGSGGRQTGQVVFRFSGQLAGAPVDPARGDATALASIELAFDPNDVTRIGEQRLTDRARWDDGDPALSVQRMLTLVFDFMDGDAMMFEADLSVSAVFSSKAQLDGNGELLRVGDTGSVQADFSHTLEFMEVRLPDGYTMTAASGFNYFDQGSAVPEPQSLALLSVGLALMALRTRRRLR